VIIGTWNVAYGRGPLVNARRQAVLANYNADVWVLTETHESLTPGDDYVAFNSDIRTTKTAKVDDRSHWTTVWVRQELVPIARPVRSDPERTVACEINTSKGPLIIFGSVLPWYTDRDRYSYEEEVGSQILGDAIILPLLSGARICVAGDFNMNLGGPHYYGSRRNRQILTDALRMAELTVLTDYDATKSAKPDYGLIDHVAVSTNFASRRGEPMIIEKRDHAGHLLSDHHGVVVELDLH